MDASQSWGGNINDSQAAIERVICADRLSMAQAVFGPLDPSAVLVDQPEAWRLNAYLYRWSYHG